jgi:hypothetical protein
MSLIVGFTFSMAITRYEQRKLYEEEEANAIGTEYVRTELLPDADAANVRRLLKEYLEQRILFYQTRSREHLRHIAATTDELQARPWETVKSLALAQPSPVTALVVSGMNDVLNAQGYIRAAWGNMLSAAI